MNIKILRECGIDEALLGLSLSYNIDINDVNKLYIIAKKLCNKDSGHNKFLESIIVWLDITAPRYWWQQFDTYRTGTSKQSESTMHTILKQPLSQENFELNIPIDTLNRLNFLINNKQFDQLKIELPEGFLQRRIICTNYKVLRNMILQRKSHKLHEWVLFCENMKKLFTYDLLGIE